MDLGDVISSIRDRLAVVAGRREELERQCADVEREYARLAAAVSVLEEHAAEPSVQPSGSEPAAEPPPLTARVFDALLGSSANTRSDLVRVFRPLGVNENSLDSAIQRLKQRGTIQQRGKYLVPGVQTPVPASSPSSDDAGGSDVDRRSSDPRPVGLAAGPDQGPLPGVVAASDQEPSGGASARRSSPRRIPLTVRVQEAVATSVACTRAALVKHFALQGTKESAVDTALSGLRKRGKLVKRDRRLWVVSASDVPSPAADPAPLDS